ncbi:MAG: sulfite exporter TauE/SafE family protein [Bacteroidia bacterium]|nr:sulfite exporter TauE/SafE family protein [Bacteroidia bacterium]
MDLYHLIVFTLIGAFGGFMAGMLGIGGGIVFIPIIQEIIKNSALDEDISFYLIANSLAIIFVVGISGSIKQYKLKNTDIKASIITGICAILSSLSASALLNFYHLNDQKIFRYIFAVILVLTALRMWLSRKQVEHDSEIKNVIVPPLKSFVPIGVLAGIITALTGLGGGVIMVPYFNKILKLPLKFSTGLSLSIIPIVAAPLLIFYMTNKPGKEVFVGMQSGYIMWTAILPIVIAAGIASPLGVKFANQIKPKTLLFIFLSFIAINLIKTLFT